MKISKKIAAIFLAVVMTFSMMPMTAFATEGTGEGGSGFQPGPDIFGSSNVAMIGDTGYETLPAAISAATSGDVIKMVDDTSLTSSMNVNTSFTLDLNGHTITSTAALFNCYSNYEFTIDDTAGNGAIDVNADKAIYVSSGKLILNGGAISAHSTSSHTYGVQVGSSGSFEMNGGSITIPASSTSTYNYCVNNGGTTIINGGELVAQASGGNYAISSNSNVTITGGSVTAYAYPAGFKSPYVLYFTGGTANVSGGYFKAYGDSATYSAGYLIDGNATTSVTGGYFGGNYYYGLSASKIASGYTTVTLTDDEADPTDAAAKTAGYKHKVVKAVAKVGSKLYATLEAAVEASAEGSTIELIDDVHLEGKYGRSTAAYIFNLKNRTLDLKGYTISMYNHGAGFAGDNMIIKNGTFECVATPTDDRLSYALPIYAETFTRKSPTSSDLSAVSDKSTGVVLEDLTLNPGGLNVKGADVTVKDCNVTATCYYAVWAEFDSNVKVESGTYTAGTTTVFGASNDAGEVAHIYVAGGNFVTNNSKDLVLSSAGNVTIKGGFYHKADTSVYKVPAKYLAPNCTQNLTTGEVTQSAPNNQASLEVNETIVEDIYVDEDFYGAGATVKLYYNENSDASEDPQFVTETYEMSELPAVDGGRLISVPQAPAQATEPVTVRIYRAGQSEPETTINTNAYSYCREIITGEYEADLKEVAESTLDYAAAAQLNFNYNTGDLANKDAPAGNDGYYNDVDGADLSGVAGFVSRPSNIRRGSIVVKSDLEINLFADYDIKVNSASLDTNRGGSRFAVATTGANGSYWAINVKGIEPANMNNTITVNTDSGPVVFTANTILKVLSNSSDAKLATLAKAAYLYGTATEEYFA